MKFRKKPVVIEAMPFLAYTEGLSPRGDEKGSELWQWLTKNGAKFWMEQKDPGPAYMMIQTLEGNHRANVGDYIIKGVKGEFYPCKPDIFRMTYQPEGSIENDPVKAKDQAYWERNQLVAALSKLLPSWLAKHDPNDKEWEDDWRNIVVIAYISQDWKVLQMTWHIHDSDLKYFSHLKVDPTFKWDGHTTEEKYKRLERLNYKF